MSLEKEMKALLTAPLLSPTKGESSAGASIPNGAGGLKEVAHAEDTPAYRVLQEFGLLNTQYRKENFDDIFDVRDLTPNSTRERCFWNRMKWGVQWTPGCGLVIYSMLHTDVIVPPSHVCRFIDSYLFAKPGIHSIKDSFLQKVGSPCIAVKGCVYHGNRFIVTIPQGKLGFALDMGQPVLLPPGLHSWTSNTLQFQTTLPMEKHVIEIGPYTILTVDEGYAAITQNNGEQVVLDGGLTHLLTHQKWRFEKFMTLKIQTDDLERIEAASADNVIMEVTSSVVWKIVDVRLAATMAAETMATTGTGSVNADISKLRRDVLKQAIASLAGFMGSVNYSDSFHVAAAAQRNIETAEVVGIDATPANGETIRANASQSNTDNPMFDTEGMSEAVSHANTITGNFGIEIISINIISANPVDQQLTASLATGAVAAAEALQAETTARGQAKAMKIEAEAKALTTKIEADCQSEALVTQAKAEREAQKLHAEGSLAAAELIGSNKVAVMLESIKVSAASIKPCDKIFFAQDPSYMPNVFMNRATDIEDSSDFHHIGGLSGAGHQID